MKKLFYLLVPLLALFLTLSPQKARAQVDEYLCVKGSATINIKVTGTPEEFPDLWYSTDKTNWTQITGVTNWNTGNVTTYFKGHNPNGFNHSSTNFVSIAITGGNPALGGNIMSLIDDVNFATNNSTIPCDYCFYALFCPNPPTSFSTSYSTTLTTNGSLYHAKDMVLPATNLTSYCYAYLLAGNSGLYNGPQLPAMVMQPWCYAHMFDGCQNNFYSSYASNSGYYLSDMKLPAQQLAEGCYAFMFNRCAVLYNNDANNYYVLPAEELAPKCYMGMFGLYNAKCTTLKYVEIMATSLQDRYGNDITNCLAYMFNNATAAKSATGTWLYGRGNLTLKMYWLDWGAYNGTAQTGDGPTQSWFLGYSQSSTTFLYQNGLTPTTIGAYEKDYASKMYCNPFPYSSTLTAQNYTYLTFNCAANGGTWEEGSAYNTDLRRVVRANYTAKTIPAPPVKANARFLGWFTTASGEGSMLTESQLKQITTATTVYARFVDNNDKYTFFVNPSDKATITVTDNSSNSYTPGTLYILDSNDKTFTLSCTGVTSGYTFYRWIGGQVDGNTVTFREGQKDLTVTGIITGTPNFAGAAVTVYQVGTGAGTSNVVPLPAEAVDLGDAGIWAKYNVDKTTANGFAASETAMGSYFAWGMITQGASTTGNFYDASSMVDGQDVPVTEETDAAYKYCGPQWRVPTKDEFQTLLDNTTQSTVNYYNQTQTLTSNTNGNTIKLANNGYTSSVAGSAFMTSVINYWTRTLYSWNTSSNSSSKAWGYRGGMSGGSTVYPPVLSYQDGSGNTSVAYQNQIYYGCGIRPILNVNKRVLTINSNGHTYTYNCDLYQTVTVTAEADEDEGYKFARWKDEAGNVFSTTNPLVVNVYDNLTYTAEFEEVVGEKRTVTFYDDDMTTPLYSEQRTEGLMPVYRGSTPTKEGYTFAGWTPAFAVIGATNVNYYATYLPNYTITTVNGGKATITLTADGYAEQTVSGTYMETTEVVLTVDNVAGGYSFVRWSDGNTDNPRTVTVTGNATYTVVFGLESLDASVDVYQNVSANTTKILYYLPEEKEFKDGKKYSAIDMGYGVAWADRNVGATSATDAGTIFYWGDIEGHTTFAQAQKLNASSYAANYRLTVEQDAAYKKMGACWRVPTDDEFLALRDNTNKTNNQKFANLLDNDKYILLPGTAGVYAFTQYYSGYHHYWTNTLQSNQGGGDAIIYIFTRTGNNKYYVQPWLADNQNDAYNSYGMPIRAIYKPEYNIKTLTINIGAKSYVYKCQEGQSVIVTAHATTEGYVFDKWLLEDGSTPDNVDGTLATRTFVMTENITRTATFKEAPSVSTYTVHFLAGEGSGTMSDQEINVGEPTNLNANTFTAPTATITYDYQGATGGNSKETDVVTAEFDSWYDEDSETSYNDEDEVTDLAAADETVTLTAQWMYNTITLPTPTKTGYTFAGWEDEDGGSHDGDEMFFPEKSQTFTATWTKATTLDLYDNRNAAYYNNIKDLNGKTYDVTYHRSVKYESDNGNARWYTLCLPFDVDQSQLDLNGLTGKVYEYRYAEGSADENDHVTFHFRAVKSPNYMLAGRGYLVKATGDMGPDFTFTGVTLDTDKDTETDVNDLKLNSANAYKESGDIAIVGVLRNGTLSNDDRKVMGLANNKIWYPHSSGNPMPAYRAYFYNPNASASVMPRVRIEVEGEGTTELEVVDGELYDARGNNAGGDVRAPRKYIRNGVLIIERNGVTYDAQGKRL